MRRSTRSAARLERLSFLVPMSIFAGFSLIMLVAPTVIVLITSFTDSFSLKFPPTGYSVRWYAALLESDDILTAARNSLLVAVAATIAATLLGVAAALALARRQAVWARSLDNVFMSPLLLPQLAYGLSALVYFSLLGLELSITNLVIGHVIVCTPFVLRTSSASLAQVDPAWLESSASLGAGRIYTFRRVVLPSIRGGVLAGAFLAFMASFDNVPVSLFLSDARTEMLPIRLWHILEASLDVRAASVSGVLIGATLVLMLIMERLVGISRQLR
jgi:putative spermidine/putrescine transport system permease protein